MRPNFYDIAYLQQGTVRQQEAYHALTTLGILERLAKYNPVLVGTIPIAIDIESSDLDIICYAPDLARFEADVHQYFQHYAQFTLKRGTQADQAYIVANFYANGFEFELFAQNKVTEDQNAYRHMLIEYRLLELSDDHAREAIIQLKQQGLKTEPAFAQYFALSGNNPYDDLLKLYAYETDELRKIIHS